MKIVKFSPLQTFNYNKVDNLKNFIGVYIIKCSNIERPCYVGMSDRDSIKKRLGQHLKPSRCHNAELKVYVTSRNFKLSFCYHSVSDKDLIRDLEAYLIVRLQPLCNNQRDLERRIKNNSFVGSKILY